ncbi:MAG TPA: Zn-ribbon domain-containing OB-fold protein [Candidatus Dormibacteraeota bacterium]|nr:Zn-ribbon domain-containing OB-fold protein [Candidatus Dormibacteraeota bacterium]
MTERAFAVPDVVTQPFWDGIAEGVLRLQRCAACGRHVFYPRAVCPFCMAAELRWEEASGRGAVHSFTVVHRAPAGYRDEVPYVVALVDLDEGVRMMTRLVDVAPADVRVGLAVEVAIRGEPRLPYFRPRS